MDNKTIQVLAVAGSVVTCVGLWCYTSIAKSKDHKAVKKMEEAFGDISEKIVIKDEVVEKAVNKVVETKLGDMALDACRKTIQDEVKASVKKAYDETKETISKKLEAQCQDVNLGDVVKEIENRSVDEAMKRITKQMDDITADYTRRIRRLASDSNSGLNIRLL